MNTAEKLPQLIRLDLWANAVYGKDSPTLNTLRRWAREGKIQPPPELSA